MIYLGWRDTSHPFYKGIVSHGYGSQIDHFRNIVSSTHLPAWVVYSLPDGLWMFSFVLFMLVVWEFNFSGQGRFWIMAAVLSGLAFEIGQAYSSAIGRFDWCDLSLLAIGAVLPILLFTKKKEIYEQVF